MTNYKPMGTTDDITTCQICGKPELKGTIILGILDADGNVEEVIYAGSTCGARRLGGRTTAKQVREHAAGANRWRREAVEFSQEIIDHYASFMNDAKALTDAYAKANAGYFRNFPQADATAMAFESMKRHREVVATNGLSVL